MNIVLNGKPYEVMENNTLLQVLDSLNISSKNIIAEVNGEVVTSDKFMSIIVKENDVIELVRFVGGG